METDGPDRRRDTRYKVRIPVVIPPAGQLPEIHGVTRDVSRSGVYFYTPSWPPNLQRAEFRMVMPPLVDFAAAPRAICSGRVLRLENYDDTTGVALTIDEYRFE